MNNSISCYSILLLYISIFISVNSLSKTVTVFGGTGGVGQLISKVLSENKYSVNVFTRDINIAKKFSNLDNCELYEGNALDKQTIIPSIKNIENLVISVGTTAFPTKKWNGGNNPRNACYESVKNIIEASSSASKNLKKVVLISSIGVERTDQFPFKILNSYGVLDAKLDAEKFVINNAANIGYEAIIIRPGRLVGEPFTNFDLAKLFNLSQGSNQGIVLSSKDDLSGDVERKDVATSTYYMLERKAQNRKNTVFSIINKNGPSPSKDEWINLIKSL